MIEPSTLSKANTRKATVRGQPSLNKLQISRVIELATGIPPDFQLIGEYRTPKNLIAEMVQRNSERGRRACDAMMPLDFSACGLYTVQCVDDEVHLTHRYLNQTVVVPPAECPPLKDLFIERNLGFGNPS